MPENLLPAILLQIFVVGYTPGPANIYALTCAIRYGRRESMKMWCGLLTGAVIAVLIMTMLTHFIGEALGGYVIWLKYLGAAYLVYLAYKMWKSHDDEGDSKRSCSFSSGLVMQLTNAKILLFELSVFSTFVLPYSDKISDLLPVAAMLLLAGPGANFVWLMAGSFLSGFFNKYHKTVNTVAAVALLLCSGYIAFS